MWTSVTPEQPEHTVYAGFWWRVLAFVLDWIVLTVADSIITFAIQVQAWEHDAYAYRGMIGVNSFIIWLLYFPLMESSRLRATLGKLVCGLVVVDDNGRQLGFSRAFGRNLGKTVSAVILMVGFMMAGWTHRKQALHDMMAGCLVLKKTSPSVSVRLPEAG
jgi:uncharacterized RDD family membrane protein YckC